MSQHTCDECGMDRTVILSFGCPECSTFEKELEADGIDYLEWREEVGN